ncbi:MAG: hypothetical protein ACOWYE_11935 [Desulfatiglandales bacterium]
MESVVTWIVGVFLAGFIGFFGKYLGKILIERMHARRMGGMAQTASDPEENKVKAEYDAEKQRLKLEKKRMKLIKKQNKKEESQED